MYKQPEKLSIKWWPSLQDYNEAIQNPRACLQDIELRNSLPYTNAVGLPRAVTGSFASVYRMHCADKDYALRLFLRNIEDQAERYALISDFVQNDSLPYTVIFHFLAGGIKSRGEWLPALKMEWVEGTQFDDYIVENLNNSKKLEELAYSFIKMMEELRYAGIAHGDLQHGNIIVCGNELRLVDYDGMFVPAMKDFMASELGHPNYQHPGRAAHHFGPYLDNFSAWIIYASIKALQIDPRLLHQLGGGDDCLLFRKSDFISPLKSAAFAAFEKHESLELQQLGRFIRAQLNEDVSRIPYLHVDIPQKQTVTLTPIAEHISSTKEGPRLIRSVDSDWLGKENLGALKNSLFHRNTTVPGAGGKSGSWTVHAPATQQSAWVKPTADNDATSNVPGKLHYDDKGTLALPPELADSSPPRSTTFDSKLKYTRPEFWQWLSLLNPTLLLMFYCFFLGCTVDENLRRNGQVYNATITSVVHYETRSKSSVTENTDVTAVFRVNGKPYTTSRNMEQDWGKYRQGDVYPVYALPSNPTVHEPFCAPLGTTQKVDQWHGILCLILNLIVELLIWARPLWHKRLARIGIPVIATIDKVVNKPGNGSSTYGADVSFNVGGVKYSVFAKVSHEQFFKLQAGAKEIILCEPNFPELFIFYDSCMYKPVHIQPSARKTP